jgi:hypothetical protein
VSIAEIFHQVEENHELNGAEIQNILLGTDVQIQIQSASYVLVLE